MHVPSRAKNRLRTTACYMTRTGIGGCRTNPGSGWDRHSSVPLGAGIIWTARMANSCSSSEHTAPTAGAVSGRRYMLMLSSSSSSSSSTPVPSSTGRRRTRYSALGSSGRRLARFQSTDASINCCWDSRHICNRSGRRSVYVLRRQVLVLAATHDHRPPRHRPRQTNARTDTTFTRPTYSLFTPVQPAQHDRMTTTQ